MDGEFYKFLSCKIIKKIKKFSLSLPVTVREEEAFVADIPPVFITFFPSAILLTQENSVSTQVSVLSFVERRLVRHGFFFSSCFAF